MKFPAAAAKRALSLAIAFALALSCTVLSSCADSGQDLGSEKTSATASGTHDPSKLEGAHAFGLSAPDAAPDAPITLEDLPAFDGAPSVEVYGNAPRFTDEQLASASFESYAPLDSLGRCGAACALVGLETMPTEERGSIGQVKPSGWQIAKYDFVDGKYLYNRCHLIGYQLTGENAEERNLITGTRFMNTEGMLPYENAIADYVDRTGNHVLYRVTPVFQGEELLARGVLMEAQSIEDNGAGIRFCVYCYNAQPRVVIDYATGNNWLDSEYADSSEGESGAEAPETEQSYVANLNSKRFHYPACPSVADMKESNAYYFYGTRSELIANGYVPCGRCNP